MADSVKPADSKATSAVPSPDHDRVVMASRRPDGSPAQTAGFEYIGDKDVAVAAAEKQLREQAVSAVDVEKRGVAADGGTTVEDAPQDPTIEELQKAHDAAASKAEKVAASEVNANHKGLGDS